MEENRLAGVLRSVAMRMRADYDQSKTLTHHGGSGTTRELFVKGFLDPRLPGHVHALHNAEIITASGEVSSQCDVVIADRSTPTLTDIPGYSIIPNECVYGVIEVKTTLDHRELLDACEKIRRAKLLPKTAYSRIPGWPQKTHQAYGRTFTHRPTVGMIFAFDSIDLSNLGEYFHNWCSEHACSEVPDSVWILNKGSLSWTSPHNGFIDRSPEPGSGMLALEPPAGENVLLPLTIDLNLHFATAWMPPLRLVDYVGEGPLGIVKRVWGPAPNRRPENE